jgi:hypothetical protein
MPIMIIVVEDVEGVVVDEICLFISYLRLSFRSSCESCIQFCMYISNEIEI